MNTVARLTPVAINPEIDLFNILRMVWRRKVLILGFGVVGALFSLGYAYLVTPEYEVSTTLRPAALNDLDALNRSNVYSLSPDEALKRVGASLDSYDTRLNFFRSRPDLSGIYTAAGEPIEQAFDSFNTGALKLTQPDAKGISGFSNFVAMRLKYSGAMDGAGILNDLVRYAVERERLQIMQDFNVIVANRLSEIELKLNSSLQGYKAKKESSIARLLEEDSIKRAQLEDELKALRVQLKLGRDARLAQLAEAISIAASLGMKKPFTPSSMSERSDGVAPVIHSEVNNQQLPLYFMGTEVLQAEQRALRQRVSDDFVEPRIAQIRKEIIMLSSNRKVETLQLRENEAVFLEGIDSLRTERARLLGINTDLSQLNLVNVDQLAVAPSHPINPRKGLLVAVGLFAGTVAGILIAFLREMFKVRLRQIRFLGEEDAAVRSPVVSSQGKEYHPVRM